MKVTHSPGPWAMLPEECDRPYIRIRGTELGTRYKIANVLTPAHEGVHEREAVETRANARLIVEAPEMLRLLKAAMPGAKYLPAAGVHVPWRAWASEVQALLDRVEGAS